MSLRDPTQVCYFCSELAHLFSGLETVNAYADSGIAGTNQSRDHAVSYDACTSRNEDQTRFGIKILDTEGFSYLEKLSCARFENVFHGVDL
jgi:hypothetical protein